MNAKELLHSWSNVFRNAHSNGSPFWIALDLLVGMASATAGVISLLFIADTIPEVFIATSEIAAGLGLLAFGAGTFALRRIESSDFLWTIGGLLILIGLVGLIASAVTLILQAV